MGNSSREVAYKAVFFDRDGVLNKAVVREGKPYPPLNAEKMEIFPEACAGLERLRQAGFLLVCVTNQPDVARGTRTLANVEAMNAKVMALLPLDDLYVCLHDTSDNCSCRKPKPGMLIDASKKWNIALASSYMVGDRKGDIEAGFRAHCTTIFINSEYAEQPPADTITNFSCTSLMEACQYILEGQRNESST